MRRFAVILLLLLCCAPLACAQTQSFTAPSDKAIWAVDINAPSGSTGTFDIVLSDGSTTSGSWSYTGYPFSTVETEIGSGSDSFTFTQPIIPLNVKMQIWNGDNVTLARQLKLGAGMYPPFWSTVVQTTIAAHPVTSYTITSSHDVTISHELISYQEAYNNLHVWDEQSWIDALYEYLPLFWGVFQSLIYWLKFLFVDNLILVVVLYLTGSMAYAANTSRNIFIFYKTWFRQQTALFSFIANGFSITISIITQILQVVGQLISSILSRIV